MTDPGQQPPSPYSQPLQPPQQPSGGAPYGAPPGGARKNGLGTAALVLGILAVPGALTVVLGFLLGIPAVVLGALGRGRAKRGEADNGGVALAGLVLGLVSLVIAAVLAFAVGSVFSRVVNSPEGQQLQQCLSSAQGDQARVRACQEQFARDAGR